MGYDLRYEAVCKYTEEGINQSKELLGFLKKRHAIEVEYTKSLGKLCKSYEKPSSKRSSKRITSTALGAVAETGEGEKASVVKTSLQNAIDSVIEEVGGQPPPWHSL